jgi:hypothetical protein
LDTTLQSTIRGLGSVGYLSTVSFSNLVSTPFLNTALVSTVSSIFNVEYISSGNLISTTAGIDAELTTLLTSFTTFLNESFVSTTEGLGTLGYISSVNGGGITTNDLESTVKGLGTVGYLSSGTQEGVFSTFFINSDNPITVPSYVIYTVDSNYEYDQAPWGTQLATLQEQANSIGQFTLIDSNQRILYTGSNTKAFRVTYTCGGNENTVSVNRPTFTFIKETLAGDIVYQTINANEAAGASVSLFVTMDQNETARMVLRGLDNYKFSNVDSSLYQVVFESVEQFTVNTFSTIQVSTFSLMDQSTMTYKDITVSAGSLYIGGVLAGASGGGGGGGGGLTSLPSTISTFSLLTSSLLTSTLFVSDTLDVAGMAYMSTAYIDTVGVGALFYTLQFG